MTGTLYTLKREYQDKKIYIWNVNRNSMITFARASFMKTDIQGFVTSENRYAGEIYMNRPVVMSGHIEKDADSVLLVSDEVPADRIAMMPEGKVVYWKDALEINEELRSRKVIIYGTGQGADRLYGILVNAGVEAALFCVTKREAGKKQHHGKEIIEAAELAAYEDCGIIISVTDPRYRGEILETLSDYAGLVCMEHIIGEVDITFVNLIQSIDLAIRQNKKIYVYGKRNRIGDLLEEMLRMYDIGISGYVSDSEREELDIKSIYRLALEEKGVGTGLIVINEEIPERLIKARENIELAGFSLEMGNYTGLSRYTSSKEYMRSELPEYTDPLVGTSICYPQGKPGWKVYGKEEEDSIRIVVLGGSTSSEIFHPELWVSKLFYRLLAENRKVVIYNGSFPGDTIVDELLRLLRDAPILRPHIVISMSGVNNLAPVDGLNQFHSGRLISWVKTLAPGRAYCSGLPGEESLYAFWRRNESVIKTVSEFYGARFFGFLQPINTTMEDMSLREKSLYEIETCLTGAEEFRNSAGDEEGYINLLRLFEHQDEMYFDICHYTERGHEIIADKVFEKIYPVLQDKSWNMTGKDQS